MTKLIFVHGTGVRQESYYRSLDTVTKALHSARARVEVVPCRWGDDHGAKLNCEGKSIPNYAGTRALEADVIEADEQTLWALLYDDPLFELALLASAPNPVGTGTRFGEASPGVELLTRLPGYCPKPAAQQELEEAGVAPVFDRALQSVARSQVCGNALKNASDALGAHRMAVARALVAEMISLQRHEWGECPLAVNPILRDALAIAIANDLGGSDRAIAGWVLKQIGGLARRTRISSVFERKRGAIMDAAYPAGADILLYQLCGDDIRLYIRNVLEKAGDSVVILAHSLGGVACVDLLQEKPVPAVKLLITVGSQAPFFYEVGALRKLPFPGALRDDFPAWLNLYDPQDLLSYVGKNVFPGRVEDVPVNNRLTFPWSHTSYFDNPETWRIIVPRLP